MMLFQKASYDIFSYYTKEKEEKFLKGKEWVIKCDFLQCPHEKVFFSMEPRRKSNERSIFGDAE